ncbi:hypothetical protein ACRCUN_18940 [Mycobacterium sp. LTG2003]
MRADRNAGPMAYRLHVVATNAADVVTHAAGLIVDRVMGGWRVTVSLTDTGDVRPLQILGAELVDADDGSAVPEEDRCLLAIDADLYLLAAQENTDLLSRPAEVLIWGRPAQADRAICHRLSAAGRAFKSEALAACGAADFAVGWTEDFATADSQEEAATLRA